MAGVGDGLKNTCERFGITQEENALPSETEENKIGFRNFYTLGDGGGMFEVTYNSFNFLDETGGQVILTRAGELGLNVLPGRALKVRDGGLVGWRSVSVIICLRHKTTAII